MKTFVLALGLFCTLTAFASDSLIGAGSALGAPKLVGRAASLDKAGNPTMSITGLALGATGSGAAVKGLSLQEVEGQFTGAVDSYFYGNAALKVDGAGAVTVREVYATSLFIPHFTIKAGKFFLNFGANNPIHPHAQPLIDRPLAVTNFFGPEGLSSVGVETTWRLPLPWHADLVASATRAEGTTAFATANAERVASQGRLENWFLVADDTVLGVAVSGATGSGNKYLGGDVTLKLKRSFAWTTELIYRGAGDYGIYSTPLLQVLNGLWTGGRLDLVEGPAGKTTMQNVVLAYAPSDFSMIRAQMGWAQRPAGTGDWQLLLQYGMTLGSHSLHAY